MALSDWWNGTPQQVNQTPLYSTQNQQTINDLLSMGKSQLQSNPASFAPIAQEARSNFAKRTVPMLAERYGSFSGSSNPSSGEIGLIAGAGADLDRGLAALGGEYNQRQQALAHNLIKLGLTPSFENLVTPPQPGASQAVLPAVGNAAGELAVHGGKALINKAIDVGSSGLSNLVGTALGTGAGAAATAAAVANPLLWPVLLSVGAGLAAGSGGYWLYNNWSKVKNIFSSGGKVEDVAKIAPPEIALNIMKNPQAFQRLFNHPSTGNEPPKELKNVFDITSRLQGINPALQELDHGSQPPQGGI
jgi:hypothetical protein